jgi:hypothetical protein
MRLCAKDSEIIGAAVIDLTNPTGTLELPLFGSGTFGTERPFGVTVLNFKRNKGTPVLQVAVVLFYCSYMDS